MRAIPISMLLVLTAAAALAGDDLRAKMVKCGNINDATERLSCYDKLIVATAPPAAAAPSNVGGWWLETDVSKIDDSASVYLIAHSKQKVVGRYKEPVHVSLTLRCHENKTSAIFHFGGHFMSDTAGAGRVTYRLDKNPAKTASFSESTNHEALFAPNAIEFIKGLFGGETLTIRAAPYNENAIIAEFNVTGTEEAVKPLRQAYKW